MQAMKYISFHFWATMVTEIAVINFPLVIISDEKTLPIMTRSQFKFCECFFVNGPLFTFCIAQAGDYYQYCRQSQEQNISNTKEALLTYSSRMSYNSFVNTCTCNP